MPIEDRNLAVGMVLTARFREEGFRCTVEAGEGGKLSYVLEDGRHFTSPSAAGSAIMNGTACNGWRWWSLASEAQPAATKEKQPRSKKAKSLFTALKSQESVPEGQIRYFCSGCQDGFNLPADETPTVCPQGHSDQPTA